MMSPWFRWMSLALLLLAGAGEHHAHALPPPPPARMLFRSFGVLQGLDNMAVTSLLQDSEGFLWVGTQGNVFRFEGQRFQSFGLKDGLPSGYITSMASGQDQGVWVGTWSGLAHFEENRFKAVPFPIPEAFPRINALAFDGKGALWIASSAGAFVMEPGGKVAPVAGWPEGEAHAVCPGRNGVWFSAGPRLLFLKVSGKWIRPAPDPSPNGERIHDILVHPDGRLFARSISNLWVLPPGAGRFSLLKTPFATSTQSASSCYLAPTGEMLVPTDEGILSIREGSISRIAPSQGVPTASPRAVLVDREGSFWVAGQGIHRGLGTAAWRAYTTQEGLPHDQVWAILRDSRERLWVGTNLGVAIGTPKGWQGLAATRRNAIRTLLEGPDGHIWAGTAQGEILILTPSGQILYRLGAAAGLKTRKVLSLSRNSEGIWVGTDGDGLFRVTLQGGAWKAALEPLGKYGPERISQIISDSRDRVWVATDHGLALRHQGSWRFFDQAAGLRQNHASYLNLSSEGELRVAYFEPIGLSRFSVGQDGNLTLLEHLDSSKGLASDLTYFLGEDAFGRLWVGGGRGVDVFRKGERRHFGSDNGLVGEDCDATAFMAEPDGQVWVGTSTGLAHYQGGGKESHPSPPSILLISARLGSHSLPSSAHGELRVRHRENDLSIQFAGSSFISANQMEYAYRLTEGPEEAWKLTRNRELHIAALTPGSYVLQLRCRQDQGEWGPVKELRFSIEAAWWQWWWLRSGIILLILGAASRLIYWHVLNLKQRNRELEILLKLSDSLAQELESANLNLQEQTLTDPLTGLKNRRFLDAIIPRDLAEVERLRQEDSQTGQNMDLLFLIIDIDHFKWVNDHYGHQAGDAVLQQFADVLKSATRGSDTVIRYGGEEFLILARQTRREDAIVLAERIRKFVATRRFILPSGECIMRTCSIGFAPYPVCVDDLRAVPWERVLELADQCLYQAKDEGRNRWLGLLPRRQSLQQPRGQIPQDLESLLNAGHLQMVSSNNSEAPCGAQVDR